MIACRVLGVGIAAPGLADWAAAQPILTGTTPYIAAPMPRLNPARLPANERRRASAAIRLALAVADEAAQAAGIDPAQTATVFTSSGGDIDVVHGICQALCEPAPALSPTAFHNSVHNAPAGYWSIATGATPPYTALSALDGSVAAGLIEACTQLLSEGGPILMVAYEVPMPLPLSTQRPAHEAFACALVLDRATATGTSRLELEYLDDLDQTRETTLENPALEILRRDNAAARVLPLLALLATDRPGQVTLPSNSEGWLRLRYTSC
ncbi:beta-ketoacyl synthase chain length factor [Acidihalobacter yilgarnensis]|uniref:beta-ketoacyl synthase chain length factor n=1 Tax=Acidihalobacter yilgarnensis TaxID=2819280 RepID=UPI0009F6F034|nr:beta-ketoacyl synthase chain length factor [Acidihalobacter yilgarnensis]